MRSRPPPTIDQYMTHSPLTVAPATSLADARALMVERNIHHLPVVQEGHLVGILSDRDSRFLDAFLRFGIKYASVGSVMSTQPCVAPPYAPLDEVVAELLVRRERCAVVLERGRVIGIFTAVDALDALNDSLRGWLPVPLRSLAAPA